MRIGILGTGDVGQALGAGLVQLGHEVMLGSRSSRNDRAVAWQERVGERSATGTFADAAAFGELCVVATAWSGTANALRLAGPDCGNDLGAKAEVAALLRELGWNPVDMGGIELARCLEPLALMVILYAIRNGTWNHAFKLLRS